MCLFLCARQGLLYCNATSVPAQRLHLNVSCASADGLLHESCIQKFPVHTEMEKIWPTEKDVPDFK